MKNIIYLIILSITLFSCKKNVEKSVFDTMSTETINNQINIVKISELLMSDEKSIQIFQLSSELREQLNLNRSNPEFPNLIKFISTNQNINTFKDFFDKPENKNFKSIFEILNKEISLKDNFHKTYPFISRINQQNIEIIVDYLYNNFLLKSKVINKHIALMSFDDKCSDAFHRANSRCERNGDIGMGLCLFSLPSGVGYVGCVSTVVIMTAICFDDAQEDFRLCAKK